MHLYSYVLVAVVALSYSSGNIITRHKRSECKDERDDCSNIIEMHHGQQKEIDAYCTRYMNKNDPAVLECKKTCGFCKAPAPPGPRPSKECRDEAENCVDIVSMHHGRQEDIDSYCEMYKNNTTVKKCKKTCGKCKAPAPIRPEPSKECRDEAENCVDIVSMHHGRQEDIDSYCELHKNNPTVKKCYKTCGKCKAPAPPQSGCEDTRPGGCHWITDNVPHVQLTEYCEAWKNDEAIQQCRKTCRFC